MNLDRTLLDRLDRLDGWACAFDRRLAELDEKINRVLERLPDPAGQAEPDGPVEPFAFRLGGTLHEGFRPVEWRLLKCLWDKERRAVTIQEAIEKVYGENAEGKDGAIIDGLKRLARKLLNDSIPAFVHRRSGYFVLELIHQEHGSGKVHG